MKKASREMGFGDDWKKALEKVKNIYVAPRRAAGAHARPGAAGHRSSSDSTTSVTVPPLAEESLAHDDDAAGRRMRVNPFFLGGETIQVSYPTNTMSRREKP